MEMTQYQKDLVRMWDSLREDDKGKNSCFSVRCEDCPLDKICIFPNRGRTLFNAEEAIEIVKFWNSEYREPEKEGEGS